MYGFFVSTNVETGIWADLLEVKIQLTESYVRGLEMRKSIALVLK